MSAFSVTDSAGIELIVNSDPGSGSAEALVLKESLRIGTVDGPEEYQFFRITSIALDMLDRVWVADRNGPIRVFDRNGGHVRTVGRQGQGPGEFGMVARMMQLDDRMVVYDSRLRRATVLDTSGTLLHTLPVGYDGGVFQPDGAGGGRWVGRLIPLGTVWPYEIGVVRRDTTLIATVPDSVLDMDGPINALDTVVSYAGPRLTGVAMGGGMGVASPLWEPDPIHRVDSHGRIYVTASGGWQIDVRAPDGHLLRRIRRAVPSVPIDDRLIDTYFDRADAYFDTLPTGNQIFDGMRYQYQARRNMIRNENLPALGRMYVAADGTIWVERPDRHPDPVDLEWFAERGDWGSRWDLIAPSGRWLGEIHLDEGFQPRSVTATEILGIERDELGVEYVVGYSIPPNLLLNDRTNFR